MIGQPPFSIPLFHQLFEGLHPTQNMSILIMLSSLFFCLVFLLRPCAMPCMIIFASHVVLVTAEKLYHCEMRTRDLNYGKPTAYIVEGGTGAVDIGQSYNIAARCRFDPDENKSTKTFSIDGTVSILVAQGLLVLCMYLL